VEEVAERFLGGGGGGGGAQSPFGGLVALAGWIRLGSTTGAAVRGRNTITP